MSDEKRSKCLGCKSKPTKSGRSKWCFACYKNRRKRQLKANNVVWRGRVRRGTAGHHVRYRVHATEWAKKHKTAAIAQAKKYKLEAHKLEAIKIVEKDAGRVEVKKTKKPKKAPVQVVLKRIEKKAAPAKVIKAKTEVKTKPAIKAKPPTVRKAAAKKNEAHITVPVEVTLSVPEVAAVG